MGPYLYLLGIEAAILVTDDDDDTLLLGGSDSGCLLAIAKGDGVLLHLPVVAGKNIVPPPVLLRSRFVPLPRVAGDELVVVVDGQNPPPALAGSRRVLPSVPAVDGCIPTSAKAGCG